MAKVPLIQAEPDWEGFGVGPSWRTGSPGAPPAAQRAPTAARAVEVPLVGSAGASSFGRLVEAVGAEAKGAGTECLTKLSVPALPPTKTGRAQEYRRRLWHRPRR